MYYQKTKKKPYLFNCEESLYLEIIRIGSKTGKNMRQIIEECLRKVIYQDKYFKDLTK